VQSRQLTARPQPFHQSDLACDAMEILTVDQVFDGFHFPAPRPGHSGSAIKDKRQEHCLSIGWEALYPRVRPVSELRIPRQIGFVEYSPGSFQWNGNIANSPQRAFRVCALQANNAHESLNVTVGDTPRPVPLDLRWLVVTQIVADAYGDAALSPRPNGIFQFTVLISRRRYFEPHELIQPWTRGDDAEARVCMFVVSPGDSALKRRKSGWAQDAVVINAE
jgi:hypothetical protein